MSDDDNVDNVVPLVRPPTQPPKIDVIATGEWVRRSRPARNDEAAHDWRAASERAERFMAAGDRAFDFDETDDQSSQPGTEP